MSIFAIALLAGQLIATNPVRGDILDACGSNEGTLWITSYVLSAGSDSASVMLYRIAGDEVTLVDTLGVVRGDAVSCVVAPVTGGGCAVATEVGMGYTAVSLRTYGSDGTMDWEIVEDGTCYDSPCSLVEASDGGLYLLWDSWSEDRGLRVLRAEADGEVAWRTFAMPTVHPMPSLLCSAPDGGCVVAATTLVLEGDTCMVLLDREGRLDTTWSAAAIEEAGAVSPAGLWTDGEVIRSAWTLEPGQTHLDTLIIFDLTWEGAVLDSGRFELAVPPGTTSEPGDLLFDGSARVREIEALPDGRFVLLGRMQTGESGMAWIGTATGTGIVDWWCMVSRIDPAGMDLLPDGVVLVTGDPVSDPPGSRVHLIRPGEQPI